MSAPGAAPRALLAATLLAAGAASFLAAAVEVEVRHYADADFDHYRTYAWKPLTERPPDHPLVAGGSLDRAVRSAVSRHLERKGMREAVGDERPDFWIAYYTAFEDRLDLAGVRYDFGWLAWADPDSMQVNRSYQEGTLVLDVIDAESDRLVWAGWAVDWARHPPDFVDKVGGVVGKILRHFPPR